MKPYLLLLILCPLFAISGCTRYENDLNVSESILCNTINQFVDEVLPVSGDKFYNVAQFRYLTSGDSLYLSEQNSLFSKSDIEYIFKQNRTDKDFRLDACLQGKELISPKEHILSVNSIKAPIFTLDKEIVIIGFSYYCGGLCGSGGTYVYKKVNGTWQKIITLMEWIS
jgi:hypothetical protein